MNGINTKIVSYGFIHFLTTFTIVSCDRGTPKCEISPDPVYGGNLVDCMHKMLLKQDLPLLPFENTTTLLISYNVITDLPNNSLSNFTYLRRLECSKCFMMDLKLDALRGLKNLETLRLDRNTLEFKMEAFPKGVFRHVPNLQTLDIQDNANMGTIVKYSDHTDIFDSLSKLKHLYIDSFETLKIGEEFIKLRNLQSLHVFCRNLKYISNNSLNGFQNSNLSQFHLIGHGASISQDLIGFEVFQFLPNISDLNVNYLRIGNQNMMRLMKPLRGRTMTRITFNATFSSQFTPFQQKITDGIITVDGSKHLGEICVEEFYWYNSHITTIETDAPITATWKQCLVTAFLETDPIILDVDNTFFFKASLMKKLQSASHMVIRHHLVKQFWNDNSSHSSTIGVTSPSSFDDLRQSNPDNRYREKNDISRYDTIPDFIEPNNPKPSEGPQVIVTLPPSLRSVVVDGNNLVTFGYTYRVRPNNVSSFTFTNCYGELSFYKKIYGFDLLETIDFQGSQLGLSPDFFSTFPSLKKLILRRTQHFPNYILRFCKQIVENASTLEYLDIAENGLEYLEKGIFHTSKSLRYLCLASNRFTRLPFDLKFTPSLEVLDLRGNLFIELSPEDRAAIDGHTAVVKNFTILLDNNQWSCSCSAISFMAWLQDHKDQFDRQGNYSCMTEDGTFSFTASYKDVISFWRTCQARYHFLMALIMACALTAGYLAMFLGMKHKTQIISGVMQLITPGFRLKTRHDFAYDVCIGYADQEGLYVRNVLLRCLEDMWHLRTFVHQRDLMQDPLLMSQAIRDSWRCLLVITDNFLYRHDMAHNVMKVASFFVTPSNPRSVVVLVTEEVKHLIPDYVLQVVDEDNIIVAPTLQGFLDYETKESLKTRLL